MPTRADVTRWLPESIKGLLSVLSLLPKLSRPRTVVMVTGVLIQSFVPVAAGVLTGLLIGGIPEAVRTGETEPTSWLLVGIGVLVVLERATAPILQATAATLGRDVDRYLQERVMEAVGQPTGIQHLEDPEVINKIRTARGLSVDAENAGRAIEALPGVIPSWLRALASVAVLFFFHWWLGLIWLVMWPIVVHLMQREYFRVGAVTYNQSSLLRRTEYYRDLALTPGPAKEIRIWGMLDWLLERFDTSFRTAIEPVWKTRKPRKSVMYGTTSAILLVNLLTYVLLVYAGVNGVLSLAAIAVFVQALAGANSYTAFDDNNVYLSRAAVTVPKILSMADELSSQRIELAHTTPRELPPTAPREQISFQATTFRYPNADRDALAGLELDIEAHRSLAIVGDNGAGKTTFVKLLCRLYEPTSGQITVDGTPLGDLDPRVWRERIAVLFQDFARYPLTAKENVGLGAPSHNRDLERLEFAAERAGALDVIRKLPNGWDTVLSREFTGGVDLSGGQWQRIALARAMFAVDAGARVLVLDEPTAALDVRAEAELYDRFLELTEGLTTCLISHRFSTVRRADRIVVMTEGGVVEDGTHDELIERDGRYAHMFALQAERFRTEA